MRALTFFLSIGMIAAILAFPTNTASAQLVCLSKMSTSQWSTWTSYYKACNSEMKTTFTYTKAMHGSPEVNCVVDNTPFNRYYNDYTCPGETGSIVEWTHCTNLNNHRLLMDQQTGIDLYGFVDPCSFSAEYFADQPE